MKTIEIMRKLIAQPFDNLEEFTKELNRLCDIIEIEQDHDREMRQIADLKLNELPYCTEINERCKIIAENEVLRKQLENAVVLPCKVGDTVYGINRYYSEENIHRMVNEQIKVIRGTQYCINQQSFILGIASKRLEWEDIPRIGTSIFVTKSEAEARLAELKEEQNAK